MKDYSVICCYTKLEEVDELKKSLDSLSSKIEWIILDNSQGRFKSASEALNYGAKVAHGEIVYFIHQDVVFLDCRDFLKMGEFASNNSCIVGVAGIKSKNTPVVSLIVHGDNKQYQFFTAKEKTKVICCDECLFCLRRDLFYTIGEFDSNAFDGWHLYAADLCYEAKKKKIDTYILPVSLWHKSTGHLDRSFFKYFNLLKKKNRNERIVVTCCWWDYNNKILSFLLITYRLVRYPSVFFNWSKNK